MKHDTQVGIIKELMSQLDENRNVDAGVQYRLPTSDYVCPDLATREWQAFFREHPQFVGLSGDLRVNGLNKELGDIHRSGELVHQY